MSSGGGAMPYHAITHVHPTIQPTTSPVSRQSTSSVYLSIYLASRLGSFFCATCAPTLSRCDECHSATPLITTLHHTTPHHRTTVLYSTVLYCTVLYCTAWRCVALHDTASPHSFTCLPLHCILHCAGSCLVDFCSALAQ